MSADRVHLLCLSLILTAHRGAGAAPPIDPQQLCKDDCSDVACTPGPDTVYENDPVDLTDWQACDVCCIDATTPDSALERAKQALLDKDECDATVAVYRSSRQLPEPSS